jgi:putative acetyltransferase
VVPVFGSDTFAKLARNARTLRFPPNVRMSDRCDEPMVVSADALPISNAFFPRDGWYRPPVIRRTDRPCQSIQITPNIFFHSRKCTIYYRLIYLGITVSPIRQEPALDIRGEEQDDEPEIRRLLLESFETPLEADLVERIRESGTGCLSLVAMEGGRLVGYVLFSPVILEGTGIAGMGLGPIAVARDHRRRGIGSRMIQRGIAELTARCCPFIVVLGDPGFYSQFEFITAKRAGIRCWWEVPDEVFRIRILDKDRVNGVSGLARYRPEFEEAV